MIDERRPDLSRQVRPMQHHHLGVVLAVALGLLVVFMFRFDITAMPGVTAIADHTLRYLAAAGTVIVAARSSRFLWILVAAMLVIGPDLEQALTIWQSAGLSLTIQHASDLASAPFTGRADAVGLLIDACLVGIPGLAAFKRVPPTTIRPLPIVPVVVACAAASVVIGGLHAARATDNPLWIGATLLIATAIAAALTAGGRWWYLAASVVAAFLLGEGTAILLGLPANPSLSVLAAPIGTLIVGLWPVAERASAGMFARPLRTLVALNGVNAADALLTSTALRGHRVEELNPLIVRTGFLPKLVIGAFASYAIYRLRPRWLILPTTVLALVVLWHLIGAALLT